MRKKGLINKIQANLSVGPILDSISETRERLLVDKSLKKESKYRVNTIFNYFQENPDRILSGDNSIYLISLIENTGNYALKNDLNKVYKEFGLKC